MPTLIVKTRWVAVVLFALAILPTRAATEVRVASYNIRFLSTDVAAQGDRLANLRDVIERLDADVIGLQEIGSRSALELLFPVDRWHLVIDDDREEEHHLAMAVRRPLAPLGIHGGNADDEDYLFPDPRLDYLFPERRDVLAVEIALPETVQTLTVMTHHAKSRYGGRQRTEVVRVGEACLLVDLLRERYAARPFVLLGDFNDNPDDRSLNILETGDQRAEAGKSTAPGAFLVNLMEPLLAEGRVSWGRTKENLTADGNRVETIDPTARRRNHESRAMPDSESQRPDVQYSDILFDQILIPPRLLPWVVPASVRVFDHPAAVRADYFRNMASDHLPVSVDLLID